MDTCRQHSIGWPEDKVCFKFRVACLKNVPMHQPHLSDDTKFMGFSNSDQMTKSAESVSEDELVGTRPLVDTEPEISPLTDPKINAANRRVLEDFKYTKYLIDKFQIPSSIHNRERLAQYGLVPQGVLKGAFRENEELFLAAFLKIQLKNLRLVTLDAIQAIVRLYLESLDLPSSTYELNLQKMYEKRTLFQPLNNARSSSSSPRRNWKTLLQLETIIQFLELYGLNLYDSRYLRSAESNDLEGIEFQGLVASIPDLLELDEMIAGTDATQLLLELSIQKEPDDELDKYAHVLREQERIIQKSRLENAYLKKQVEMAQKIHILAKEKSRLKMQLESIWGNVKSLEQ